MKTSMQIPRIAILLVLATSVAQPVHAQPSGHEHHHPTHSEEPDLPPGTSLSIGTHGPHADSHAPIGVMGDHLHEAREWMLSYRFLRMKMSGNRDGTDNLSQSEIATSVRNPFFGRPGQPPTLRVVPTEMTMDMHMFGGMYAPTDWLTLMAMGMYVRKDMDHTTFQGPVGTTRLGRFTTRTEGFGDTRVAGLVRLFENEMHRVHLNAGLSLPTGSIREKDRILTPMNMQPRTRLPYPMQLGSGTFDLMPGLTYAGHAGRFGWGAQYIGTVRLGRNDEGYSLGDQHQMTGWGSITWTPWISNSLRLVGHVTGDIDGQDRSIVAPVQTADPDNHGGERIDLLFGVNLAGPSGWMRGHRIAVEAGLPVYQHLNGPQLETDWLLTIGYQFAF